MTDEQSEMLRKAIQEEKEAFRGFARGVTFVIVVMGVFFLFIALIGTPDTKPEAKFKVVETYRGCDVVRYTDPGDARYHYFLDCPQGKNPMSAFTQSPSAL
jgi:hypothetical protein